MRKKHNTFLAGVAALTLFAASGAFAQGQPDQKGGADMKAQGGMQTQRSDQGAKNQGSMSGQNARSERQPGLGAAENATAKGGTSTGEKSPSSGNRGAQDLNRSNKGSGTADRTAQDRQRNSAESKTAQQPENRDRRGAGEARRDESLKGLQGNTTLPMRGEKSTERGGAGANVTLNEQQRTQIRDTIINGRGAPRVGNVDFDVTVGTVVSRTDTSIWCACRKHWCGSIPHGADSSTSCTTMRSSSSIRTT
jgi:hypothetical protein